MIDFSENEKIIISKFDNLLEYQKKRLAIILIGDTLNGLALSDIGKHFIEKHQDQVAQEHSVTCSIHNERRNSDGTCDSCEFNEKWEGPTDHNGEPILFLNHYTCPTCKHKWEDEYSCQVDGECPQCSAGPIEPHTSEDINQEFLPKD